VRELCVLAFLFQFEWQVRLMHVASAQAPSALVIIQLRRLEARGHKSNLPKRQRAPFRQLRLMLVASEQAASALVIGNNLS